MSFTTTTDVFCDLCDNEWTFGCVGPSGSRAKKLAWLNAKAAGYKRRRSLEGKTIHICPKCIRSSDTNVLP